MNRTVLFGTLLLALAAVPALPTAVAYDPCVKNTCPIVDDELPWLCVGVNHQWEAYGACANADPACVGTRSGRLWQEYCATAPAAAPSELCVGVAPELGGTMTCADPKTGCVSHQGGVLHEEVCATGFATAGVPGGIVRTGDGYVCLAVAPEYGGTMTCAYPKAGCASHHGGVVRETVCASEILALILP